MSKNIDDRAKWSDELQKNRLKIMELEKRNGELYKLLKYQTLRSTHERMYSYLERKNHHAGILLAILLGSSRSILIVRDTYKFMKSPASELFEKPWCTLPIFFDCEKLREYIEEPKWYIDYVNLSEYREGKFSINIVQKGISEDHSKIHKYIAFTRDCVKLMDDAPYNKIQPCAREIPLTDFSMDDLKFFLDFIELN